MAKIYVSPPTLPTSSSSQHSCPSISELLLIGVYYRIQCTVALLFRTISNPRLSLPLSLPAEGIALCGGGSLRVKFGLRSQSFSNRRSFSLFRNSFFSFFFFSFFFILRRVFVFACAALFPVASLKNLQQKKNQCSIYGRRQPRLSVGMVYISASRNITSRRVNVYKETVGRFERIQGYITLKYDIYPGISLRSRGPSSSSDLEINTRT